MASSPRAIPGRPAPVIGPRWFGLFAAAWVALWAVQLTPLQLLLPLQLDTPDTPRGWIGGVVSSGLVLGIGGLAGVLAGPWAGALSDRMHGARRRPWALAGSWLTAVGLGVMSVAHGPWGVGAGWVIVCAGAAVASAAFTALIADQLPVTTRGAASAVIGSSQAVGVVLGVAVMVLFGLGLTAGYVLLAVVMAVVGTAAAVLLPDPPLLPREAAVPDAAASPRALAAPLRWASLHRPDFVWMLVARLLINVGNALVTALLLYFLLYGLGLSRGQAETDLLVVIVVYTVFVVLSSVLFGLVTDRSRRRRGPAALAGFIQALSVIAVMAHPSVDTTLLAGALMGIGYGAYSTVGLALATDLLPDVRDHARDLGVVTVVAALGQLIGPVFGAGLVAAVGGFWLLFVASLVCSALGAAATLLVRGRRGGEGGTSQALTAGRGPGRGTRARSRRRRGARA